MGAVGTALYWNDRILWYTNRRPQRYSNIGLQNFSQIQPTVGCEFDPATMECFETIKDETKPNNTVCEIIHNGYKLYDHILKPALVKVIKNN